MHRPAAQSVLSGGVWEPDTISFMRERAFDPNAENYACALWTILLNSLPNVSPLNVALGSASGAGSLCVADPAGRALGGGSLIRRDGTPGSAGDQPATIVAIDDVIPEDRNIAILQLDVEGYQDEAIRGARRTIEAHLPVLIIEGKLERPTQDWLHGLGYREDRILHANTVWTSPRPDQVKPCLTGGSGNA